MNLASISENKTVEKRVAITPDIAKKYISSGFEILLEKNYGEHLGFEDKDYEELGVKFSSDKNELIQNGDIIIQLNLPEDNILSQMRE